MISLIFKLNINGVFFPALSKQVDIVNTQISTVFNGCEKRIGVNDVSVEI